jgi:hypothetical protein
MDKAAQGNRTNQCNPNHAPTGPGKVHLSCVVAWVHQNHVTAVYFYLKYFSTFSFIVKQTRPNILL